VGRDEQHLVADVQRAVPSRQADLGVLIGQGRHPGPRDLYDRHPVFHRELLEAHVEHGAGAASADHRGHAVQRWLERQVERQISTVHEHVRSGLDLGQGAGLRGEVVRAGAAA